MTEFSITQLPARAIMLIDGAAVVLNQKYPIAQQSLVTFENDTVYRAEPYDNFKYEIYVDGEKSKNEGLVDINFEVSNSAYMPANTSKTIHLSEEFLFSDEVPYADNFDRVQITSIQGKGDWLLNEQPINVGQVIFYYELAANLKFLANDGGAGNDYNILKFKAGTKSGFFGESTLWVNTEALAKISLGEPGGFTEDGSVETTYQNVFVSNTLANKTCKISVDTTNFTGLGTDPESKFVIYDEIGNTQEITTQTTVEITTTLSNQGQMNFETQTIKENPYPVAGSIVINLLEVDGSSANVDPANNQVTINIPTT